MSPEVQKKQLELLKSRLKKAYSLPFEVQEKWKDEIEKLEQKANILRTKLGITFDEDKASEMLINTNKEIIKLLKGNYGNGEFNKFLDNNKEAEKLWNETDEINVAFKLKDRDYFKECLKKYKENILKVDEMYATSRRDN